MPMTPPFRLQRLIRSDLDDAGTWKEELYRADACLLIAALGSVPLDADRPLVLACRIVLDDIVWSWEYTKGFWEPLFKNGPTKVLGTWRESR